MRENNLKFQCAIEKERREKSYTEEELAELGRRNSGSGIEVLFSD